VFEWCVLDQQAKEDYFDKNKSKQVMTLFTNVNLSFDLKKKEYLN